MAQFIFETHSIKITQLHINSNICVCINDVVGLIEWTMEINYRLFACRVVRESSSHVEPVSYSSCTSMINLMCFLAPLSIQRPFLSMSVNHLKIHRGNMCRREWNILKNTFGHARLNVV